MSAVNHTRVHALARWVERRLAWIAVWTLACVVPWLVVVGAILVSSLGIALPF